MKMPTPVAYGCKTIDGVIRDAIATDDQLEYETQYTHKLYSEDQLKQAVRDALEEASKAAEGYPKYGDSIAEEIRAMKEQL